MRRMLYKSRILTALFSQEKVLVHTDMITSPYQSIAFLTGVNDTVSILWIEHIMTWVHYVQHISICVHNEQTALYAHSIMNYILSWVHYESSAWCTCSDIPWMTSMGSMTFPSDLLILRPCASRRILWNNTYSKIQWNHCSFRPWCCFVRLYWAGDKLG